MSNMKTIHFVETEMTRERILEDENRLMYMVHAKVPYTCKKTYEHYHRWKQTTFIVVHFKDNHVVAWTKRIGKVKNHHRVIRRAFPVTTPMTTVFGGAIERKAHDRGMKGNLNELFFPAIKDLHITNIVAVPSFLQTYLIRPNPTPASFAKWLTGSSRIGKGTAKRMFNMMKEVFFPLSLPQQNVLESIRTYKIRDNDKLNTLLNNKTDIKGMAQFHTRFDPNLIRILIEDKPINWFVGSEHQILVDIIRMIHVLLSRNANRESLKGYKNIRAFIRALNLPDSLDRTHDQLIELQAATEIGEYDIPLPINKYLEVFNGYTYMGYKIVLPTNGKELHKVGLRLQNCVAGYTHSVRAGNTNILYVVDQDNKPIYCIEVGKDPWDQIFTLNQFSGRFNKNVDSSDSIGYYLRQYIESKLIDINIEASKELEKNKILASHPAPQQVLQLQGVDEFQFEE